MADLEYEYGIARTKSQGGGELQLMAFDSRVAFKISNVTVSATAAGDTAGCPFRDENAILRVRSVGGPLRYEVNTSPTATSDSRLLAQDEVEYVGVKFGQKPAAIAAA